MSIAISLGFILVMVGFFIHTDRKSRARMKKYDEERPALERRERIKLLIAVVSITGKHRIIANRELKELLDEEFQEQLQGEPQAAALDAKQRDNEERFG